MIWFKKWKLNRQFLYRQPKLEIAINAAKEVNNNIHFKSYKEIVSKDTEKIFNDDFWKKQDAIIIPSKTSPSIYPSTNQ